MALDDLSQQALALLILNGEAVDLTSDLVLSSAAQRRRAPSAATFTRTAPRRVTELKAALQSPLRIMVRAKPSPLDKMTTAH